MNMYAGWMAYVNMIISVKMISCSTRQAIWKGIDPADFSLPSVPGGEPDHYSRSKLGCVDACLNHDEGQTCMAAQYVPETQFCYFISSNGDNLQAIPGSSLYMTAVSTQTKNDN